MLPHSIELIRMIPWRCVVPSSLVAGLLECGARWGFVHTRRDEAEQLLIVDGYSKGQGPRIPHSSSWLAAHYSRALIKDGWIGAWFRAHGGLHAAGFDAWSRGASLSTDGFREHILAWQLPPADGWMCLTVEPEAASPWPKVFAWMVGRDVAQPYPVDVVREDVPLLEPLQGVWPVENIADELVVVVGVGSIGSVVAEALVSYGVRRLALVDPDRLKQHNFARHRVPSTELGRAKVNAVADMLLARDSDLAIGRFPMSVVKHANAMRSLFAQSSIVVTCSDGVESRRASNHFAARARVPHVLACVLEDGAIGEIMRCVPYRTQCLLCHRASLITKGMMDPDTGLGGGYEGTRPMAAVGGDLAFVGQLAAKAAVATLLERKGDWGQRLGGDHAVLSLRPARKLLAPYDPGACGEVVWRELDPPDPSCFSCSTGN